MGALELKVIFSPKEEEINEYISGYWNDEDVWDLSAEVFRTEKINTGKKKGILVDFTSFRNAALKSEMKFYLLHALREKTLSVANIHVHYKGIINEIGIHQTVSSFEIAEMADLDYVGKEHTRLAESMQRNVIRFMTEFYDERPELERDVWHAQLIPGVKLSAAIKRQKPSISFEKTPDYYKGSVKRYMKTLIYRRSWSFCTELLIYIRYFYQSFYTHGYKDGFQENLTRLDVEKYLGWVAGIMNITMQHSKVKRYPLSGTGWILFSLQSLRKLRKKTLQDWFLKKMFQNVKDRQIPWRKSNIYRSQSEMNSMLL